jgi:hypothetical protein
MSRGVIYYNVGTSCAVRLLVSLVSLRQYYSGPVTILSEGTESHDLCRLIGKACDSDVKQWTCDIPRGPNWVYLAKTQYHMGTPYNTTVALDADTLIVGSIDELFEEAEMSSFCVAKLGNCKTYWRGIAERIRAWQPWLPNDVKPALEFGPAINCGVVAFLKKASLYRDWTKLALPGRDNFIPDETCCQVILHRYPHKILDSRWNCSCKHDNPEKPDTRIIHFHGRNHCRPGLPSFGRLWVEAFDKILTDDTANITKWTPANDRVLSIFLRTRLGNAKITDANANRGIILTKRQENIAENNKNVRSEQILTAVKMPSAEDQAETINLQIDSYGCSQTKEAFPPSKKQALELVKSKTKHKHPDVKAVKNPSTALDGVVSLVMLSWNRPDNVHQLAERYSSMPLVREVLVLNNNPAIKINKVSDKMTVICASHDLGLFSRFAVASMARTPSVLLVDDDLFLPEETVRCLYEAWLNDPLILHGIVGRNTTADGYSKTPILGPCEIVLTRGVIASVKYCAAVLSYALPFDADLNGSPKGNGEDIIFSLMVRHYSQRFNMAHSLPIAELPAIDSIHHRIKNHFEYRSKVVLWWRDNIIGESPLCVNNVTLP